ncbi:PucR family transcriptional regulator [Dactylosporangium sp. CA-152071]|uniref:PucR family transcriptional regulator n=1 Tax=Dactylosporangium sp. CA-152071 TaxID=3239933 RepID=UPI003D8F53B4
MHDEIDELVDDLAAAAGLAVQLTDTNFNSLTFGPHRGEVDWIRRETLLTRTTSAEIRRYLDTFNVRTAMGPVHIPADPSRDTMARLVVPVRSNGRTVGFLWFLDDGTAAHPAVLDRIVAAAERLGRLLNRDAHRQQLVADRLRDLVGEHEPSRQESIRFFEDQGWSARRVAVTVAAAVDPAAQPMDQTAVTEALDAPRGLDRKVLRAVHDDAVVLLSPAAAAEDPRRTAGRALDVLAAGGVAGWVAGVGGVHPTLAGAADSYRQARCALRVARSMSEHRPIADWPRLGALRVLTLLPVQALQQAIEPRLLPVLADATLVETLRTYLVEAGDIRRTCAALHVHRGTVYYRLRKIEQLSQLSLRDGDDRLTIHTSLHMARLAGMA